MSDFILLKLVVLLKFIIDKRSDHTPIDFFNNHFGKSRFSGLLAYLVNYLLDAVRRTNG